MPRGTLSVHVLLQMLLFVVVVPFLRPLISGRWERSRA
jgi:hypothetical protein